MNKYGPVKHLLFLLKRSIIKNDIYLKIAAYLDMLQISHQPVENGLCKPIFEGCRITQAEELREKIRSLVTGWGYTQGGASVNRPRKVEMGKILVGWK